MVERVDVEADVDGPVARRVDAVEGAGEALPHAEAVDDLHGEGGDVERLDHRPLGRVHVADADEGEPAGREAAERKKRCLSLNHI